MSCIICGITIVTITVTVISVGVVVVGIVIIIVVTATHWSFAPFEIGICFHESLFLLSC